VAYFRSKRYVIASYNGKSARTPILYFIVVTVSHLATHPTSVVSAPQDASSAIICMQIGNVKNPMARLQNLSTAAELILPTLPTVLHNNNNNNNNNNNSVCYINGNRMSRSQPHLPSSCKQAHFGVLKSPVTTPTAQNLDSDRISASDYN
jgi:hypothetical protein